MQNRKKETQNSNHNRMRKKFYPAGLKLKPLTDNVNNLLIKIYKKNDLF